MMLLKTGRVEDRVGWKFEKGSASSVSDAFDEAEAVILTDILFMTLGDEELHCMEFRAILSAHSKKTVRSRCYGNWIEIVQRVA
ncbi:hypothetical protein TNCV_543891 [Trichonephila clavipes]|nr:hypothetical protein TNCV_543891 [Trichonephila clavipes]